MSTKVYLTENLLQEKDAEISRLKAELREATDIITMGLKGIDILLDEFIPAFRDLVTELGASEEQIERIGLDLLEGEDSIRPRARAFLDKHSAQLKRPKADTASPRVDPEA